MKKSIATVFAILLLAGCQPAGVQPDVTPDTETPPTPEASTDLSGTWSGTLSHVVVSGPCPATPTQRGDVTIVQTGSRFTMTFGDDFDCNPEEACEFSGDVDGKTFNATNGGVADDEGGVYTTTLSMAATDNSAQGSGSSTYVLKEMTCQWSTSLDLVRN